MGYRRLEIGLEKGRITYKKHERKWPNFTKSSKSRSCLEKRGEMGGTLPSAPWCPWLTMTIPPDCSAVHMLMIGAMPMVVPWKYTPLGNEKKKAFLNSYRMRTFPNIWNSSHSNKGKGTCKNEHSHVGPVYRRFVSLVPFKCILHVAP